MSMRASEIATVIAVRRSAGDGHFEIRPIWASFKDSSECHLRPLSNGDDLAVLRINADRHANADFEITHWSVV
jgi:hypothetical protein